MPFQPHCGICFEAYVETSALAAMQCGHAFHRQCLLKWFDQRSVCPKCNHREQMPLFRRTYIPIYLDGQTDNNYRDYQQFEVNAENSEGAASEDIDWHYWLRTYIVPIIAILIAVFMFAIFLGGAYAEAELKRLQANEYYYVAEIRKLRAQIEQMNVDQSYSLSTLSLCVLIIGVIMGRLVLQ